MKYTIIFIITLCFSYSSSAQKKNFTMEEAVLGMTGKFAPANLKQLQWADTTTYSFILPIDSTEKMIYTDANYFEPDTVLTLQQLNGLLSGYIAEPLKNFPVHKWVTSKAFYTAIKNDYYYVNIRKKDSMYVKKLYTLPQDAENASLHIGSLNIAYTSNHNLYILQKFSETPIQITTDGSDNIVYGAAVHRNEFGIENGIFWNSDGSKLAYYRMDQSMVTDYPVIDWKQTPATVKNIKYPFAGQKSHEVNVIVYDIATKTNTTVKTSEPKEQYLTTISWHPNSASIFIGVLNREQNHLWYNAYDTKTGDIIKTVFEETHSKYVEPLFPAYFLDNGKNQFVWMSQRNGFMHMYLYDANGTLIKQLTDGNWLVNDYLGYNKKYDEIIFESTKDGYINKNIYAVSIKNGEIRKINTINGMHTATISKNAQYVIDSYTGASIPRNIEITDIHSGNEKRLLSAVNKLTDYNLAKVEYVKLKADDGTELLGKLILPADFDKNKKYPTIVYLYNGPHVQLVNNKFPESGNLWYDYMTQHGYVIFTMDGRGSSNRGFNFESAVHRQLGTVEMSDQLKGLAFLKEQSFVDTNNIGVHGWSFGGFMTTSLMLRQPGAFKCGVAGGPVLDWSMYEIMYTERYMDTPQENPDGYKDNCLLDKTKNLKGDLLMIHGTDDDVVVWQHSIKFLKSCVDNGVQVDYFVYPGHPHNVRGKDRVHLMQKITDYFDEKLK